MTVRMLCGECGREVNEGVDYTNHFYCGGPPRCTGTRKMKEAYLVKQMEDALLMSNEEEGRMIDEQEAEFEGLYINNFPLRRKLIGDDQCQAFLKMKRS